MIEHAERPRSKHSNAPEWSYELTKENLLGIEFEPLRDFAVFAYVLGGRLNEVRFIRPVDISSILISTGEERIVVSMFTEKNPNIDRRIVPVNPISEKHYVDIIWNWKLAMTALKGEKEYPFRDFSERQYQRWLRKELDTHPHALRHLRVHHVDDQEVPGMKPLSPRQFMSFFGWHLIETSAHYQSRTRGKDLAELM